MLFVEWSWVLALRWRSLGELLPFDITWSQEVSGGPAGKLALDHGTLAVAAAQAPGRGGVDSDLCSHTGFLVAAAADLASHACLWGPR